MKDFNLKEFILNVTSKASIAVFGFFAPVYGVLAAVGLAIIVDTFFGVWKVKKTTPHLFSSTALRKGFVTKVVFYQVAVLTIFCLDYLVLMEFSKLFHSMDYLVTKLLGVSLIMIEAVSINESFKDVNGKNIIQGIKDFINSYNTIKKDLK